MNHAAKYPSRCFGVVLSLFLLLAISVSQATLADRNMLPRRKSNFSCRFTR
jgi:hypothetical protein